MTNDRTAPAAGRVPRRAALLVPAVLLFVLSAAPAAAQVPPLPDAVQDVVDTVDEVTSSDDPIREVIEAVDDAAGDVTGTEDPVEDAVDDAADTVDGAQETVDDTVEDVGGRAGDVVDAVDEATGGTVSDIVGDGGPGNEGGTPSRDGGPSGRSLSPDGSLFGTRVRSETRARTPNGRVSGRPADTSGLASSSTENGRTSSTPESEQGLGERLREAAIDASKKLALPLTLTLAVLAYLIGQYWTDRRDPKLLLAPVDADYDLLSFQ